MAVVLVFTTNTVALVGTFNTSLEALTIFFGTFRVFAIAASNMHLFASFLVRLENKAYICNNWVLFSYFEGLWVSFFDKINGFHSFRKFFIKVKTFLTIATFAKLTIGKAFTIELQAARFGAITTNYRLPVLSRRLCILQLVP
jgi:hypothetical protein